MTNEKDVKKQISSFLTKNMETMQSSKLSAFMKLWLYQFCALSDLSWPFIINDLDKRFSLDLQRMIKRQFKSWSGISHTVDNGLLFVPGRILG